MLIDPRHQEHEALVARALTGFIREIRLVDPADFIAYLHLERHSPVAELVTVAAEMYFAPQFLKLGEGSYARLDWSGQPSVHLNLVMHTAGANIYLTLTLEDERANVAINHIAFHVACADPAEARALLNRGIANNMIRPASLAGDAGGHRFVA